MNDEGVELRDVGADVMNDVDAESYGECDEDFGDEVDLKHEAFLNGYDVLKIPVVDGAGQPVWPERFPLWKIEKLKQTVGMKKFSAQMLLEPVDLDKGRFDVSRLKFYDAELVREERNGVLGYCIGGVPVVAYGCWWDPAFGSQNGDGSVISVVFVSEDGRYFLHDLEYLHYTIGEGEKSGEEQCRAVSQFLMRNFVSCINVESNAIGKFLPELLQRMLNKTGVRAKVVAKHSTVSKSMRISSAFDAMLSAGCLYVSEKVRASAFMAEFDEWNVDSRGHDDALDSVAGAIAVDKTKLALREYRNGLDGAMFPIRKFRLGKVNYGTFEL